MKVLLSGVIPAEGRFSMLRTARTLHDTLPAVMDAGESAALFGTGGETNAVLERRAWQVKLRKRLLLPLSLRAARCDVLHIVDSDYASSVPSSKLSRTVVTCHDLMPMLVTERLEDVLSKTGVWYYRRSLARMARAARVVCDSAFTRETVLEKTDCQPGNVSVVPLGVEPAFRPLDDDPNRFRAEHGLGEAPLVLHVGSTDVYKNMEMVLRVMGRLRAAHEPAPRLLKVGGAFSPSQQDLLRREGLSESVIHLTGLTEEELVAAYNAADLLLWPSHFEGFGWPVVEAMACGLPVVCSNGGSLPEVAGDAAAVRDPMDIDGLTAACLRILQDPDHTAAIRAKALEWAASFSWERTARGYLEVYRQVATQG